MKLTIDTSVALKLIIREPGSDEARAIVASDATLIAPDIIHAEMANALWGNVLSKRISADVARSVAQLWQPAFGAFHAIEQLALDALEISLELNHAIYDCIFLALARRESAQLVTADTKFLKLLNGTVHASHARVLV